MIVCLCNALTDRDVRDAAARGAERVSQVYRECGCRVDCGKCAREMRDILRTPPRPPALAAAE
ncbi:MAG: (2Fe-2S)-binding protein [Acetobacteraceae bacterium]|nr:(2Fe-2S)-binding protein [Acetobacteraceae bacterium]